MPFNIPESIEDYLKQRKKDVELKATYNTAFKYFQRREIKEMEAVPQGLSRSILDVMEHTAPRIGKTIPLSVLHAEKIYDMEEIQRMGGNEGHKFIAIGMTINFISTKIARVIWNDEMGFDIHRKTSRLMQLDPAKARELMRTFIPLDKKVKLELGVIVENA
jgi:hypothetical protein